MDNLVRLMKNTNLNETHIEWALNAISLLS